MSGIAIYMEGGGRGPASRGALRRGMDAFLIDLKNAAREKSWRWKLVCCGGREETFRAFRNAQGVGDAIVVLLVDAEGPVDGSPRDHLRARDGWNMSDLDDKFVHLMAQVMEAWLVADPVTLSSYYGQGFAVNALPRAHNLETVAKPDIGNALERATRETRKGSYHKIHHASELLTRVEPKRARQRCFHCERMFAVTGRTIMEG